ncbi:MAG: phage tail tape measure protein, partial [Ruminococcus sp.]
FSDITENTLTLEKYFGYDVQEQLRASKMLVDQFGLSADEAFSMIVQGAQSGLDKNGDLLDSINEYSVHYRQLGYDADDFFNSLLNGTASGTFSVDKLGDAMKEFGIRSKDTANSTTEGFELIGLNADDMRNKFSQGGETAKQAMNETITALFNLDDQVKMNQAGVDLFGTMWEDLGKDGIAALSNVNGKITESTESLENINKIQFNSLETRVQSVGRRFKSEITQPIIEKALPKVETALDYLSKNMDNVIGTVKKVGEAMKIALEVGAVTKFVSTSVTGISSVINTIKLAKDAQLALNAAQKANLFGLLAGLAVGAATAIYDYYKKVEESLEPVSLLSDETNTLCEKLQDQRTAWDDAKGSVDKSIGNKSAEFSYYQDLKKELDNIVDSSGKIKSGYEDRAKFITEKLGDVTGTEIEIVDDTIQKYDELSQKLDEVLTKKKGEAYASIYADQFSEAVANKDSSLNDLMNAQRAYDSFRVNAIYSDSGARNLRIAELEKQYATLEAYGGDLVGGSKVEFNNVRKELNQLKQEAEDENTLKQALINAEDLYSEYSTTIANYENLQIAISSGTKEELDTAMYYLEHHFATAETATSGYLQRQSYRINNELSNAQTAVKNGMAGVTQEDVNALQDMNIKSGVEWRKATNNARESMDKTVQAASELSGRLWSPMMASGYTSGESFKNAANATNMTSVFDSLISASSNLAPTLYNNSSYAANMMVDGYMNTMEERRQQLRDATSYTANMITNAFYSALGIASPSKKFAWAAEMSVAGYVNQANDSLSEMERASISMAKAAVDPFQGYLFDHSVSPDLYANAAIDTADRISSRRQINGAYNQTVNVSVNLNGLSIGNVNNEEDVRKFMQRIASETQKAVFVTGGSAK